MKETGKARAKAAFTRHEASFNCSGAFGVGGRNKTNAIKYLGSTWI